MLELATSCCAACEGPAELSMLSGLCVLLQWQRAAGGRIKAAGVALAAHRRSQAASPGSACAGGVSPSTAGLLCSAFVSLWDTAQLRMPCAADRLCTQPPAGQQQAGWAARSGCAGSDSISWAGRRRTSRRACCRGRRPGCGGTPGQQQPRTQCAAQRRHGCQACGRTCAVACCPPASPSLTSRAQAMLVSAPGLHSSTRVGLA